MTENGQSVGKLIELRDWTKGENHIKHFSRMTVQIYSKDCPISFMIAHFDANNQKLCILGLTKNNLRFDVVSGQA